MEKRVKRLESDLKMMRDTISLLVEEMRARQEHERYEHEYDEILAGMSFVDDEEFTASEPRVLEVEGIAK